MDFTINGTAIAMALESLLPVLKYAIKGPLEKEISYQVKYYCEHDSMTFFGKNYGIRHPITEEYFNYIDFDFSVPFAPQIGELYSYAGFDGYTSFRGVTFPYDATGHENIPFPLWIEESTPRVQGFLGDYFMQQFAN